MANIYLKRIYALTNKNCRITYDTRNAIQIIRKNLNYISPSPFEAEGK